MKLVEKYNISIFLKAIMFNLLSWRFIGVILFSYLIDMWRILIPWIAFLEGGLREDLSPILGDETTLTIQSYFMLYIGVFIVGILDDFLSKTLKI